MNIRVHLSFQQKVLPKLGDGGAPQVCPLGWKRHAQALYRGLGVPAAEEPGGDVGLDPAAEEETLLSSLAAPKTGMFDNDELKTGSRNVLG